MKTAKGMKIWTITPCDSGFGEWQANGSAFILRSTIRDRSDLDGLIRNQTGKPVQAETQDGQLVIGMLVK